MIQTQKGKGQNQRMAKLILRINIYNHVLYDKVENLYMHTILSLI